jgi:hypothetical protein
MAAITFGLWKALNLEKSVLMTFFALRKNEQKKINLLGIWRRKLDGKLRLICMGDFRIWILIIFLKIIFKDFFIDLIDYIFSFPIHYAFSKC